MDDQVQAAGGGTATLQFAVIYRDVQPISGESDGVNLYNVNAEIVYDSTWGRAIGATVVFGLALPAVWITPSGPDAALLVFIGLLGGIGHLLITRAYQLAPIAVIAPFDYMAILWATGFGFVIFGDLPGWMTIAGAMIVVASGLYILHRETVQARKA